MGKHLTRFAVGTVAAVVALALAGCGSDKAQPPSSVRTSSSAASPTSTPTPTAPVMPDAAKQHTKEGAEAFVRYFWDVVNYAQATGKTSAIRDLSLEGCDGCDGGASGLEQVFSKAGYFVGGDTHVTKVVGKLLQAGEQTFAHVDTHLRIDHGSIKHHTSDPDIPIPAEVAHDRTELIAVRGGWMIAQLVTLS